MKDPLFDVQWTMEKGKSRFSTSWNPASETRLYEEVPHGYKLTVSGVERGKAYAWSYTALYDGKDHPVHGRADVDAIETYRVNDRITIGFFKKHSQAAGPYARKLSLDGTRLTVEAAGRHADGTPYFDVIEYKNP